MDKPPSPIARLVPCGVCDGTGFNRFKKPPGFSDDGWERLVGVLKLECPLCTGTKRVPQYKGHATSIIIVETRERRKFFGCINPKCSGWAEWHGFDTAKKCQTVCEFGCPNELEITE